MKRFLKPFIIIVTLLLPAAIYLFLRIFGENQFDIPVYYESGFNPDSVECYYETGPHRVVLTDYLTSQDSLNIDGCLILVDINYSIKEAGLKKRVLERLFDALGNKEGFKMLQFLVNDLDTPSSANDHFPWKVLYVSTSQLDELATCQLVLLKSDTASVNKNMAVLIDKQRRIRGYYDIENFEEADRLLVETKILLQQK